MATLLELGPLGQMTCTRSYAVTTLAFSTPDDETQKRAVENLQNAAEKLTSHIPWLAGQVATEGRDASRSGTHRIVDYPPHNGRGRFLKVKDLREEPGLASYEDIIAKGAPMSMIPASGLICPVFGFGSDYPIDEDMPVLAYQANLLKGGILLTICGQHNAVDGNGNAKIVHHFAKICRGEDLSEDELREANRDREEVLPNHEPTEAWDPWDEMRCPSHLGDAGSWPPKHGESRWRVFSFPPDSMAELKKLTKDEGATSAPGVKYVSTNDIATALIWRHLVRIRSLDDGTAITSCWRACNGRPRASPPMSPNHLGHTIMCCSTGITCSDLRNKSLPEIASSLRQTLNDEITNHGFQSLIKLLRETEDRTTIHYGGKMNPATDVMITSHVAHDLYNANFGPESGLGNGLPDVIRRPDLPGGQGIPWMLPQRRDGGVDVMLNLLDDDVKRLSEGKDGEEWLKYIQYIG